MDFTILKDEFIAVLSHIQGVVERKHVMPILQNALLEAEDNIIRLSATDLEVAIRVGTQAIVREKGRVLVPARKLAEIICEAAGKDISVKLSDGNRVEIISLSSQSRIMTQPVSEFPKLPEPEGEFVKVEAKGFMDLMRHVVFAVSTDETRHHLNGVYLEARDGRTSAVATDGHRLALDRAVSNIPLPAAGGIIVPRKGVSELKNLLAESKAFELCVDKRHVFARTERFMLYIRLIDADFPNYGRVIPETTATKISVPREAFIGAVTRVGILSDENSRSVKLYFSNDSLLVNAANMDVGEAREEVPLSYRGEPVEASFNWKYLKDVLGVLEGDDVVLGFNDKASPFTVTSPAAPDFLSIIMPMRV